MEGIDGPPEAACADPEHVDLAHFAMLGRRSAVMAHEIRNPLGMIDLYAKLTEAQLEPLCFRDREQLLHDLHDLSGHGRYGAAPV